MGSQVHPGIYERARQRSFRGASNDEETKKDIYEERRHGQIPL